MTTRVMANFDFWVSLKQHAKQDVQAINDSSDDDLTNDERAQMLNMDL